MKQWKYIRKAEQLVTVAGASHAPKVGKQMSDLQIIKQGSVVIEEDRIRFVGTDSEAEDFVHSLDVEVEEIDGTGKIVLPGLIDPHTHVVFAGSRERELEMRLNGAAYMEIHRQGGGILSTMKETRAASFDQLFAESKQRLDRFLLHGVTTLEAKSGYGLNVEDELKQLRVSKQLDQVHPIDIVSTFMGAHAIPPEYREQPEEYVQLVIQQMLPLVSKERLAEFCDVFCEEGVFTVEQSEQILMAAKQVGLTPKLHADEIVPLGGAELAAKMGAISADHLLKVSETGIQKMADAGVIGVLLPGTAFFLMTQPAPARKLIEAGVAVALSTDRNPGSSPTESLPLIMNLACLTMQMTPAEVITATTINAAHALGRADQVGSIEVGKQADLVFFDAPNYSYLQYHFGVNLVHTVIKKGKVVVAHGSLCVD